MAFFRHVALCWGLPLIAWGLLTTGTRAYGQPSITHCEPGALVPGQSVELTLHGAKLSGSLKVWSSFPATWEVLPIDPAQKGKSAKVKVTLDVATPVGIGGIAVAAADGASDVLLVPIDDLPSVAEATQNHPLSAAQEISLPAAIDGLCNGTTFDYYKFTAKAGQPLSIEVLGARLGHDFDPVLRLLDGAGNELALADDDPSLGPDCRLRYTFPADGQYVVELRDNRYKAGGRYRLRIGNFPLVSTALPLSVPIGQSAQVQVTGTAIEGVPPVTVAPSAVGIVPIALKLPGGDSSAMSRVLAADLPAVLEVNQSEKADEPTPATLPCAISGRLDEDQDRDEYRFTATKGQLIRFQALTRSLGSAAIVSLRVFDAAGKQLAETPVSDADEEKLSFTAPADGEYRLAVEDLAGRGGPDYSYCVTARTGPGFSLRLKNVPANQQTKTAYSLPINGGTFALQVECVRDGYDGPIELSVESPRTGWRTFSTLLREKVNETKMYVVPPADMAAGEFAELRIVGKATIDGKEQTATMLTTTQLRAARPGMAYPPQWLDGLLTVGVAAEKPSFYKLTPDKTEVNFPRLVGTTMFTLTMDRTDPKFTNQPLTVMPLDLPRGVRAEVKRNGNGPQEKYEITLTGPKDLAEGKHSFRYFAYAEIPGQGRGVVSGEVPLNVITPLAVTVAPAGPLVQGQKQKVKITLARAGDDKQPVEVKFKSLPTGVTGPASVTIAADQTDTEVELEAAADAPAVKFDELVAAATTKYAGQDLAVESAKVSLEVKTP